MDSLELSEVKRSDVSRRIATGRGGRLVGLTHGQVETQLTKLLIAHLREQIT